MKPSRDRIDRDALTIAMAVVPGIYSRNKYFAFYSDPEVRRARARASLLRGIVRQLAGSQGEAKRIALVRGESGAQLSFAIAQVRLERKVTLSDLEASCVAYLASRAGVKELVASEEDRAKIDRALRRLATGLELGSVESGDASLR